MSSSYLPDSAQTPNHQFVGGSPISGSEMSNPSSSPISGVTPGSCCDTGRMVTDPISGHTICSCQYDSRLSLSSYPRLTPYPPGGTYAPPNDQNPYGTLDSSAFYSPLSGAYLKEGNAGDLASCWGQASYPYTFDPSYAAAYGSYTGGYDLAARRKNATRESTATLKAWLNEHKKNPYPTKGEKIMLAIITKMTLTQVSTWFANARRRLKKENKMTWEPKNKTDEDEDDKDDDDDGDVPSPNSPLNNNINIKSDPSQTVLKEDCSPHISGGPAANKPKIWSLAETASAKTPPPLSYNHNNHSNHINAHQNHHHHQNNFPPPHPQLHHSHLPPPAASNWSLALPPYSRYGGFLQTGVPTADGVGLQTETPPQTPPNLKLPYGTLPPGQNNHPLSIDHNTAFKPVLQKSSLGGFNVEC